MRTVLVFNPKGGCGKTTFATNLAAYCAAQGERVALLDLDPQRSCQGWLAERPSTRPAVIGLQGREGFSQLPKAMDWLIMDSPPGLKGTPLLNLMRLCQALVVPVMPSIFDLDAIDRLLEELEAARQQSQRRLRIATVINRTRLNAPERELTEEILNELRLGDGTPLTCIGWLRSSKNYTIAALRGLGVCELAPSRARPDVQLWQPLIQWVRSATGDQGAPWPLPATGSRGEALER